MLYLDSKDNAKRPYMYINGPGGDLIRTMAISNINGDAQFIRKVTNMVIMSLSGYDIRNEANELLRIRDYLYKELAKKTGQPVEKINRDFEQDKTVQRTGGSWIWAYR